MSKDTHTHKKKNKNKFKQKYSVVASRGESGGNKPVVGMNVFRNAVKGGKKFHSHTSVNGPDGVALKDTKRKGK